MSSPTVVPGFAPRVLRGTAGRRALQLALLVGGLLALGLLCGGRAQAAEGTPTAVTRATATPSAPAPATPAPAPAQAPSTTPAPAPRTTPAPVELTLPVSLPLPVVHVERVLRPVQEVVTAVTGQVAQVSAALPLPVELPVLTDLGRLPDPAELPDASEPPSLPAQPLPLPLPVPVIRAPAPDSPVTSSPDGHRSRHVSQRHKAADAAAASYGPVSPAGPAAPGAPAGLRAASHHDPAPARAGQAPTHRAPGGGEPSGLLGGSSALDGGASRHADAQAVTVSHRMPVPPVSGVVVRSDAAGTRDAHRDVPVFPG
ncbi:hypothetical protein U5640_17505 [Streptomyces sp. SS7]|uniref:hypothetical protein n=1 Tax=Streptomyces sp. SS7 TaxID=3108485 RepID=UPI0030ECA662